MYSYYEGEKEKRGEASLRHPVRLGCPLQTRKEVEI